jgi:hypothetical protein
METSVEDKARLALTATAIVLAVPFWISTLSAMLLRMLQIAFAGTPPGGLITPVFAAVRSDQSFER